MVDVSDEKIAEGALSCPLLCCRSVTEEPSAAYLDVQKSPDTNWLLVDYEVRKKPHIA